MPRGDGGRTAVYNRGGTQVGNTYGPRFTYRGQPAQRVNSAAIRTYTGSGVIRNIGGRGDDDWALIGGSGKPKPKPKPRSSGGGSSEGGGIDYSAGIPQIPVLPAAPKPPAPILMPIPDDAAIRAAKERERAKKMAGRKSTTLTQSASNNLN